jgi:DNA-binding NarL/FixJ family response regulator
MSNMAKTPRRLLIVEDELLMRGLLHTEFTSLGFEVEAVESAAEAKKAVRRFDPDIAVIDINLQGTVSGLHFGHFLALQHPEIAQVYLTAVEDIRGLDQDGLDIPSGAGFVSKHKIGSSEDVVTVIDQVIRGRKHAQSSTSGLSNQLDRLGPKASRTLQLLSEGFSNRHIAQALGVTEKTVEYYVDQGYKALEIEKSSERNQRVEAALRFQRVMFASTQDEISD